MPWYISSEGDEREVCVMIHCTRKGVAGGSMLSLTDNAAALESSSMVWECWVLLSISSDGDWRV